MNGAMRNACLCSRKKTTANFCSQRICRVLNKAVLTTALTRPALPVQSSMMTVMRRADGTSYYKSPRFVLNR